MKQCKWGEYEIQLGWWWWWKTRLGLIGSLTVKEVVVVKMGKRKKETNSIDG